MALYEEAALANLNYKRPKLLKTGQTGLKQDNPGTVIDELDLKFR